MDGVASGLHQKGIREKPEKEHRAFSKGLLRHFVPRNDKKPAYLKQVKFSFPNYLYCHCERSAAISLYSCTSLTPSYSHSTPYTPVKNRSPYPHSYPPVTRATPVQACFVLSCSNFNTHSILFLRKNSPAKALDNRDSITTK